MYMTCSIDCNTSIPISGRHQHDKVLACVVCLISTDQGSGEVEVEGSDGRPKFNRVYNNLMEAPSEVMKIKEADDNTFEVGASILSITQDGVNIAGPACQATV